MYGGTHAEYMQEPADEVTWSLAIHRIEVEVEAEQKRKAQAKANAR